MRTAFGMHAYKRWVLVLVIVIVCFYAAKNLTIARLAHAQVRTSPFVLTMHVYSFERNTAGELMSMRTVSRRSDGTTAVTESVGPVSWNQSMKKVTFMDGRSVTLSDLIAAKSTVRRLQEETARLKNRFEAPPQDCRFRSGQVVVGKDNVVGHEVSVLRDEHAGLRLVNWAAPNLGCEDLRYTFERKQPDGSYRLITEGRPITLVAGEPQASVFDAQTDYTEMKPSDLQKGFLDKIGMSPQIPVQGNSRQLDRQYLDQKK